MKKNQYDNSAYLITTNYHPTTHEFTYHVRIADDQDIIFTLKPNPKLMKSRKPVQEMGYQLVKAKKEALLSIEPPLGVEDIPISNISDKGPLSDQNPSTSINGATYGTKVNGAAK